MLFRSVSQSRYSGQGEGYYRDSGGFVSSDKKLIDSDYYQEYSYEIQTKVPFSKYYEVLNKLVHVAGSKMFGKVVINSFANSQVNSANSVSRLITLNVTNGSNSTFSNSEFVVFSNGNSNSTIYKATSNNISPGYRDWETDRKSTRLNSSHSRASRMPSSA